MRRHSYTRFRLYGYPSFGVLLYLIIISINPIEPTFESWRFYTIPDFVIEQLFTTAYASLLFETGIWLTFLFNRYYPWENRIKRRITLQLLSHISIVCIVVYLFFLFRLPPPFSYDGLLLRQAIIIGIIISILVTAVFTAEYFFYSWNEGKVKTLEMEKQTVQAQLNALKLQLDPHFLFNNLSIVTALIEDNPKSAVSYVSNLSSIYRYMLSNRMKDVIALSAELEFIKAYLYLYQIRYEVGILVEIDDSLHTDGLGLPPLTLQLLIENAIKHNSFSSEQPLRIQIFFPDRNTMVINNNRRVRVNTELSSKMGLQNIIDRYELLNQKSPIIIETDTNFKVEIPLIRLPLTT